MRKTPTCLVLALLVLVAGGWRGDRFSISGRGRNCSQVADIEERCLRHSIALWANAQTASSTQAEKGTAPERYTLTPEQRARAVAYSRLRYSLYFIGVCWALVLYFLLWWTGAARRFRSLARRATRRFILQCLLFFTLFTVVFALFEWPLDFYSGFVVEHRFGLSTESFASWMADWGKGLAVAVFFGTFLVWVLYRVIQKSPQRWWFYFWLATIPIALGVIFVQPLVVDPLFYKFTPLDRTEPELTTRIEQMLGHAGLEVPRSHIFEMNASSKTRAVDAYVTGLGASKRVVIWDTTLQKMTPDETLLVVGHELGHYVLYHIPKEFALIELVSLGLIYLAYRLVLVLMARCGPRTGLEGVGDLASWPLLLGIATFIWFLGAPAVSGISRHYEHQADLYGLEVAYGVVPDPNAAEARALQVLGEEDLADPDPSAFIKFWLYTHPPLDERIRFAVSYKPWAEGKPLEFVRPTAR